MKDFLTVAQVAQRLPRQPSAATVWRWCVRGIRNARGERVKLPHVRLGGRVLVRAEDVEVFLDSIRDAADTRFDAAGELILPTPATQRTEARRLAARAVLDDFGVRVS